MKNRLTAIYLTTLIVVIAFSGLKAQNAPPATTSKVITGKVTDAENEPLEGVTVQLKGKPASATTNSKGIYNITVSDVKGAVLTFTMVGYSDKDVALNGNTTVYNVKLNNASKDLDDVIVIGYGTVRKRDLTGSVGQVKVADVQKAPVASSKMHWGAVWLACR